MYLHDDCFSDDYVAGRTLAKRTEVASDVQGEGEYGRGLRRIKPIHRDSDSSESSDPPVQRKQRRCIPLPEPSVIKDLKDLRSAASNTQLSSPVIDRAVKPVMMAVTKCETRMEQQQKMIEEVLSIVKNIKNQLGKTSAVATAPDTSVLDEFLPLCTYEDMTAFEVKLTTDSDLKLTLEHRLRLLGGTTVKSAVKYMIDCCLSSSLQNQFNWEGWLGWKTKTNECKKGFKHTHLCKLMMSILVTKANLETDEAEARKAIMVYLRNAGDRCFGRKRRSDFDASSSQDSL